jgi:hypothetical protein
MSAPRGLTKEQLAMVKEAGVSMCLQEEKRLGRRLTEAEANAVLEKFSAELETRRAARRS